MMAHQNCQPECLNCNYQIKYSVTRLLRSLSYDFLLFLLSFRVCGTHFFPLLLFVIIGLLLVLFAWFGIWMVSFSHLFHNTIIIIIVSTENHHYHSALKVSHTRNSCTQFIKIIQRSNAADLRLFFLLRARARHTLPIALTVHCLFYTFNTHVWLMMFWFIFFVVDASLWLSFSNRKRKWRINSKLHRIYKVSYYLHIFFCYQKDEKKKYYNYTRCFILSMCVCVHALSSLSLFRILFRFLHAANLQNVGIFFFRFFGNTKK